MAIPKPKPQETDADRDKPQASSPQDYGDDDLAAEMKALEEASIADLTNWEQNLSDE